MNAEPVGSNTQLADPNRQHFPYKVRIAHECDKFTDPIVINDQLVTRLICFAQHRVPHVCATGGCTVEVLEAPAHTHPIDG